MTDVNLVVEIDDDEDLVVAREVTAAVAELTVQEKTGGSDEDFDSQIEPVTAILIAGRVVAVAMWIRDWWTRRPGGLVIDQRPGAEHSISRDKSVPWGYVVIYPPDGGIVNIVTKDAPKDEWERLLESIVSGAFGSTTALADVASKALGADKVSTSST
jgi:hypothetical protein